MSDSVMTETVETAVARVSRALLAHAGGLELVDVTDGTAHVRFTGACTGCPARPLTYAATVRPVLSQVPGVTAVVADGVRLDEEQEQRLARWAQRGADL